MNLNKTKMMIMGKTKQKVRFKINNIEIENVTAYKYMGITIDKQLNFKKHIADIKNKARDRLYVFKVLCGKNRGLGTDKARNIYRATIRSILENASSITKNAKNNTRKK